MSASHTIMDGKVHLYRRSVGRYWQCAVFLSGRNYRQTTRQENLAYAIEFARDWFLDRVAEDRLRRRGLDPPLAPVAPRPVRYAGGGHKFRDVGAQFLKEFEALTLGERSPKYLDRKESSLRLYLNPFFGNLPIAEVTAGRIQEYRVHRMSP
ncbi:MAG TPA: site-specific integrase, partial [Phenylobacterium sp.]|nr:site-specific integrase [Phenylobacterium sp.]